VLIFVDKVPRGDCGADVLAPQLLGDAWCYRLCLRF
jgi:hypothetical protein